MPTPPRKPSRPWGRRLFQLTMGMLATALTSLAAQGLLPDHGAYTRQHTEHAGNITADHSKYKILQGPFKDGDGAAVTRACVSCHLKAARQVMATKHWRWRPEGRGLEGYGKSTLLVNNFCISTVGGNQEACSRCHAGYGMTDRNFDYGNPDNVDCLVCHDTTGDYEKVKGGYPNPAVPLAEIAQKVGLPNNQNCGVCHFFGGGADATKHGDLDDTILKAPRAEDVHLSKEGAGMVCIDCHAGNRHDVGGPDYVVPADRREKAQFAGEAGSRMSCAACHTETPHASYILNRHYRKVACQTCHIPSYARGGLASNLTWNWSSAGRLKDGRAYEEHDSRAFESYNSIHGEMTWDVNVKPEYVWYNGNMTFIRLGEKLPDLRPVPINTIQGDYNDPAAKLWPFKRHDGDQPFDPILNDFVAPYTAGPQGSGAYWGDFNWDVAIKMGMDKAGLAYSNQHAFVTTTMWWPITHMVAPKEQALACAECHAPRGRMAKVEGFYLLGRDRGNWLDKSGWTLVFLTGLLVSVHGTYRVIAGRSRRKA